MGLQRLTRVLMPALFTMLLYWLPMALAGDERTTLSLTRVRALGPDSVRVFVSVLDANERPVSGLDSANFSVRIDGRPVTGWELAAGGAGRDPLSLVLAVDRSGSMKGAPIEAARQAAASLLRSLSTEDRVSIIAFGDTVQTLAGFTAEQATLTSAIAAWQAVDARTHLNEAVYEAANRARAGPTLLSAVLVLTDGRDEGSALTLDDAIQNALTGSIPVYAVGVGSQVDAQALRRLARLTGGRFLAASSPSEIGGLYRLILTQMQGLYTITIPLREVTPGKHVIHVTVRHQGQDIPEQRAFEWSVPGSSSAGRPSESAPVREPTQSLPTESRAAAWRPAVLPVAVALSVVVFLAVATALVWFVRRRDKSKPVPAETCAFCHTRPVAPDSMYCAECAPPAVDTGSGRVDEAPGDGVPWLEVLNGTNIGARAIVPREGLVIGRGSKSGWVLGGDRKMSRVHARVRLDASGTVIVEDHQSENGIRVNGTQITAACALREGDIVRMGDTEVRLHAGQMRVAEEDTGDATATQHLGG